MFTKKEAKKICDRALEFSSADATEIILMYSNSALTRYANNAITQNVSEENANLGIRVFKNNRVAKVFVNQFDEATLKDASERAVKSALLKKEEQVKVSLLQPQKHVKHDNFVKATADLSPDKRAAAIKSVTAPCAKKGLQSFGTFSNSTSVLAIANSNGLFGCHESTSANFAATVSTDNSSGWAAGSSRDVRKIDPAAIGRTAIEKALASKNPRSVPAGKYTVILEPSAASNFVAMAMFSTFSGLALNEGHSFMVGKLGKKVTGSNITLVDDPFHPMLPCMPFDFEGRPKKKLMLVEKGVAKNVVYDRKSAARFNKKPTGHTLPDGDMHGGMPMSVVMSGGKDSLEKMISTTKKGILVTEFHYTNVLDPMKTVITGMTRNGTFLVEDGKIVCGVRNFRFTENVMEALTRVDMISKKLTFMPAFFGGGFVVPALRITDFNFSSETKF